MNPMWAKLWASHRMVQNSNTWRSSSRPLSPNEIDSSWNHQTTKLRNQCRKGCQTNKKKKKKTTATYQNARYVAPPPSTSSKKFTHRIPKIRKHWCKIVDWPGPCDRSEMLIISDLIAKEYTSLLCINDHNKQNRFSQQQKVRSEK